MRTPDLGAGDRPPGRGEGALGHPLADPGGERLEGAAERCGGWRSTQRWRSRTRARAGSSGGQGRPVNSPTSCSARAVIDVEVGLQRGGQIGRLQGIVAGDAPRQPFGQPPVDRFRSGARRAQVDFLPTLTPYFSMSDLDHVAQDHHQQQADEAERPGRGPSSSARAWRRRPGSRGPREGGASGRTWPHGTGAPAAAPDAKRSDRRFGGSLWPIDSAIRRRRSAGTSSRHFWAIRIRNSTSK